MSTALNGVGMKVKVANFRAVISTLVDQVDW